MVPMYQATAKLYLVSKADSSVATNMSDLQMGSQLVDDYQELLKNHELLQEVVDNLGLNMPTTTEEFYEVMKAFKEKDANGNGDPNDEIPLSTVTSGAGTQLDGFLMNPFQLTSETNKLYVDNGKVTFAPAQEGYKEGLKAKGRKNKKK